MSNKDKYGNEKMFGKAHETERLLRLAAGGGVHEDLIAAHLWPGARPRTWHNMIRWYVYTISRVTGAVILYHRTKVGRIWQLMDTVPPHPRMRRTANGLALAEITKSLPDGGVATGLGRSVYL